MGRIFSLEECQALPKGQLKSWCYNTLDATGTREIADVLLPRLTKQTMHTYLFELALQNPAFTMMTRGVLIDTVERDKLVRKLKLEMNKANKVADKLVADVWDGKELETGFCPAAPLGKHHKWPRGVPDAERSCELCHAPRLKRKPFNANSPTQSNRLFYKLYGLKPMMNKKHEVSTDEDVLDRIGRKYPKYKPITDAILKVRDLKKQIGMLSAKLTPDNRYPSSFNVGAAWTGRFSSSKDPKGRGGNLQNWGEQHRHIAIADPGMKIGYADLKTAESQVVAYLAGDEKYIKAHKDDVHTFVTILVWPDMPWTDDIKENKRLAKSIIPEWDNHPGHDMRFQSKSVQHGTNFLRTPYGIAREKHIPVEQADRAQAAYYKAFPFIRGWQNWTRKEIQDGHALVNPMGRRVKLLDRPWDDDTVRKGVSFKPQSTVADILDLAMWRVWWLMDPHKIEILAQVHDAILFQYPEDHPEYLKEIASLMRMPVIVEDYRGKKRQMTIEVEVAVGSNWGHKSPNNPYGLEEVEV